MPTYDQTEPWHKVNIIATSTQYIIGGVSSSLKIEYNTNADYDYIEDQGSAAVYQLQEAVPYHSKGPGVSISTKTAAKTSQQGLTGNESVPDMYKAPSIQKFRVSVLNINFIVCINIISILESK